MSDDKNYVETGGSEVNHPSHYTKGRVECIEVIEDLELSYHRGNAMKYIWRAGSKGGPEKEIQDLEKAAWYLNREINLLRKRRAICQ